MGTLRRPWRLAPADMALVRQQRARPCVVLSALRGEHVEELSHSTFNIERRAQLERHSRACASRFRFRGLLGGGVPRGDALSCTCSPDGCERMGCAVVA